MLFNKKSKTKCYVMKKNVLLILFVVSSINMYSQTSKNSLCDSTLVYITKQLDKIEFRINGMNRFKLYPTENIYTFLKLDTATGKIDQLQWSLDIDKELTVPINSDDLSLGSGCSNFELYPTKNMYQFILLDKVTGMQWHVQWGMEESKRWIRRFY